MDLADIQGDILRAYGNDYDCTSYAFVHIDCPPEQGAGVVRRAARPRHDRRAVAGGREAADDAQRRGHRRRPARARRLGRRRRHVLAASFARAWPRARRCSGDVGPSDPREWEPGLGTGEAHVLLTINAQETEDHKRALGKMRDAMEAAGGIRIVYQEDTELLPGSREHFGYADGFAQPAVEGSSDDRARGGGVPLKDGGWRRAGAGRVHPRLPRRGHARRPQAAACRTRPPPRSGAAARTWSGASSTRTSRAGGASSGTPPSSTRTATSTSCRRRSSAAGPTARRSSSTPTSRPRSSTPRRAGANDFRYDRRPRRHALPGRRPHPPLQPARRARLRGPPELPPPDDPPRDALRHAAARGRRRRTTAPTAASSS